jgi:hypothetical protein
LRAKDAQQHGQRIYRGIGNRRRIALHQSVGKGECRRIGHAPGDQAAENDKVHLQQNTRHATHNQQRNDGDGQACEEPKGTILTQQCLHEARSRLQSDTGEKEHNAKFS